MLLELCLPRSRLQRCLRGKHLKLARVVPTPDSIRIGLATLLQRPRAISHRFYVIGGIEYSVTHVSCHYCFFFSKIGSLDYYWLTKVDETGQSESHTSRTGFFSLQDHILLFLLNKYVSIFLNIMYLIFQVINKLL